jgi:nucleotide-binding universal stress UspA family protein
MITGASFRRQAMKSLASILLHLDASPRCELRLEAAGRLAAQHGAELNALYSVVPGALQFPFADGVSAELLQRLRPVDDERRARARSLFDKAVAGGLQDARWLAPLEDLSLRDFSRQALYADLLVLGQREPGEEGARGVPFDFVESVLIDSGKPALVIPYIGVQSTPGRIVIVAWKETREAARALAAALPLLTKADRVHVATWGEERSAEHGRIPALVAYLRRHGVEAALHHYGDEPRDIGEYILSAAADLNADMLVMGAYGHSRAREWVLGGATRTILSSMTIPVLMSH